MRAAHTPIPVAALVAAFAAAACAPATPDNDMGDLEPVETEAVAPATETMETPAPPMEMEAEQDDIVDVATAAGSFGTLATALEAAGLVETLKGEGPFTVFAPTDEAFNQLPEGTLDALLQDPEQLSAVLTYHVVPGEVTSSQVVNLNEAETVNGAMLDISVADGTVMVNDATVTQTDIQASNGVIHVIDSVLLPPSQ